jgi:hypothetical protein
MRHKGGGQHLQHSLQQQLLLLKQPPLFCKHLR